jgi:hypothetical protein
MQLQWTHDLLKGTHRVKHDDVLQNANYIPMGSSPMTDETRPYGATDRPCVPGYPLHGEVILITVTHSRAWMETLTPG